MHVINKEHDKFTSIFKEILLFMTAIHAIHTQMHTNIVKGYTNIVKGYTEQLCNLYATVLMLQNISSFLRYNVI